MGVHKRGKQMTEAKNQFRKCKYDTKLLCSWTNACESCAVKEYGQMVAAAEREMNPETVETISAGDLVVFDYEHNVFHCIVCGSEIKKED